MIVTACAASGRDPASVEILVATKYVPSELMGALAEAGVVLVGENQAQSLVEKHERWGSTFEFDFIGHLQSRKAKQVVPIVRLIHSIDSESAVRRVDQAASSQVGVLLEINAGGEASKGGVAPRSANEFLEAVEQFENVRFSGLMTMPPLSSDAESTRPYFELVRELAVELDQRWSGRHSFNVLSMGTSQDFAVAVEEGATIVRLGSRLYA